MQPVKEGRAGAWCGSVRRHGWALLIAYCCLAPGGAAAAGLPCSDLALPGLFSNTTVESARTARTRNRYGYCRVVGTIKATTGSRITVVFRLPPKDDWNGRLLGLGGGAFGGMLGFSQRAGEQQVGRGFAVAVSDAGHSGNPRQASWALKEDGTPNRDAIIDYAHRAVHLMTVVAKQVVAAHYGQPPRRSYYEGCSTGGRMGLVEVQRYPGDYDGVVVGAPVMHLSRVTTTGIWQGRAFHGPGSTAPSAEQLSYLADSVIEACDAADGLTDGLLNEPRACDWDPARISCAVDRSPDCLRAGELTAINKIYSGPVTSDGDALYVPIPPGGEGDWAYWLLPGDSGPLGGAYGLAAEYMQFMVFIDPDFDPLARFDFDRDPALVEASLIGVTADAINADIRAFIEHGGKLLLHHGWGDVLVPALRTVAYYEEMIAIAGRTPKPAADRTAEQSGLERLKEHARLFMVPGVYHCAGGPGPYRFDALGAMVAWVEKGKAPDRIYAVHPGSGAADPTFSRPLCPYPETARYVGPDNPSATRRAGNFDCIGPD